MTPAGTIPGISVVIPVYNGARYLPEALASLWAQSRRPDQVIVVDDGSTDNTAVIARADGGVEYTHQPNAGPAAARNRGLGQSRCEFVGFLDVDDLWPADRLAHLAGLLEGRPDGDVALGCTESFAEAGADRPQYAFGDLEAAPQLLHMIGAALFRQSAFHRVGVFDPARRFGEDLDWFIRARECCGRIITTERLTLRLRRHAGNMTRGKSAHELGVLAAVRASLLRRRTDTGHAGSLPQSEARR